MNKLPRKYDGILQPPRGTKAVWQISFENNFHALYLHHYVDVLVWLYEEMRHANIMVNAYFLI